MVWDIAKINQYIADKVEENLNLDYKSAGSLEKTNQKMDEITKDVSAMANSDGGVLIYGIAEDKQPTGGAIPLNLEPVDSSKITKEWLEQVILNIHPKIEGIVITPVYVSPGTGEIIYVVEIPQSTTAHQARDKRYYKRYNFLSQPMDDYEIRDIMGRVKHPVIELRFELIHFPKIISSEKDKWHFEVRAINNGQVFAHYTHVTIKVPQKGLNLLKVNTTTVGGELLAVFSLKNIQPDLGINEIIQGTTFQYIPILPSASHLWWRQCFPKLNSLKESNGQIDWTIFADNAPVAKGEMPLRDIPVRTVRD